MNRIKFNKYIFEMKPLGKVGNKIIIKRYKLTHI